MVSATARGILNISSGFGLATMPLFAAYCGTKHFVTGFTEGVRADLAGTGVVVTQVCRGPVATEFEAGDGKTRPGRRCRLPRESRRSTARAASLHAFERDRGLVVPGLVMKIVMLINALSPRFLRRIFAVWSGDTPKKQLPAPVLYRSPSRLSPYRMTFKPKVLPHGAAACSSARRSDRPPTSRTRLPRHAPSPARGSCDPRSAPATLRPPGKEDDPGRRRRRRDARPPQGGARGVLRRRRGKGREWRPWSSWPRWRRPR